MMFNARGKGSWANRRESGQWPGMWEKGRGPGTGEGVTYLPPPDADLFVMNFLHAGSKPFPPINISNFPLFLLSLSLSILVWKKEQDI